MGNREEERINLRSKAGGMKISKLRRDILRRATGITVVMATLGAGASGVHEAAPTTHEVSVEDALGGPDDDIGTSASYFLTMRVFNDTDETLTLDYASSSETWVRRAIPTLEPNQSVVLSVEGWAGATLKAQYLSRAGHQIYLEASNPFSGKNTSIARSHDLDLAIDHSISSGYDASAAFYVHAAPSRDVPNDMFELKSAAESERCVDIAGGQPRNGTPILAFSCHGGLNQRFTATSQGQLRSVIQSDGIYCLDIKGARAFDGAQVHTWSCDGGASEKWTIRIDGSIASKQDPSYCLTMPTSGSDTQLVTRRCAGIADQWFALNPVKP